MTDTLKEEKTTCAYPHGNPLSLNKRGGLIAMILSEVN